MAMYRPINIYPNNHLVDLTKNIEFRWQMKGSRCDRYMMRFFNANGEEILANRTIIEPAAPILDNDIVTHTIPGSHFAQTPKAWCLSLSDTIYREYEVYQGSNVRFPFAGIKSKIRLDSSTKDSWNRILVGNRVFATTEDLKHNMGYGDIVSIDTDYNSYCDITLDYALTHPVGYTRFKVEILSDFMSINPDFIINSAVNPEIHSKTLTNMFPVGQVTAIYFPSTYHILDCTYRLIDENGVVIDKVTDINIENNELKYKYDGYVSDGKEYTVVADIIDFGKRKGTYELANFTVNHNNFTELENKVQVTKVIDENNCLDEGCVKVDWFDMEIPSPEHGVVITREEDGSGIFKSIATVYDRSFIKDFNIESGKTYKYRVCSLSPPQVISDSMEFHYVSKNWFVIGLIETEDSKLLMCDTDNIWTFQSVEASQANHNIDFMQYDTLSAYPRILIGKNNYISSTFTGILSGINRNESDSEKLNRLKKWKKFCSDSTVKLIKSPSGENYICKIYEASHETDYLFSEYVTKISFSYSEVRGSDVSIIY